MSFKWHLMIICLLLVIVPVLAVSIVSYSSIKKEISSQVEDNLSQQSLFVSGYIEQEYEIIEKGLKNTLDITKSLFLDRGSFYLDTKQKMDVPAVNQVTNEETRISIPTMRFGEDTVYNNTDTVDKVVGNKCTIFQAIPNGLLRVSTNVITEEGKRAVGTYIPSSSPVYQAIMKGETYTGRAMVVNKWYLVCYDPIKDGDGKIIGALFIGIDEKPIKEKMLDYLSKIVIGKTGYVYIFDGSEDDKERGKYILSYQRKRDEESVWETKDAGGKLLVQDMIKNTVGLAKDKSYIIYYPWKNEGENSARMKIASCTYFKPWGWVIGASSYHDEFLDPLVRLKSTTITIASIATVIGIIVAYLIAMMMSAPLIHLVDVFSKVATGDLTEKVNVQTNISELKDLAWSCDKMINSVKNTITVIGKFSKSLNPSMGADELTKVASRLDSLVKEYKID